jgi:hypothetical protein
LPSFVLAVVSAAAEMGACATKPADLKVEGDAPLVLDDAAEKKAGVVETDPAADGSRRRSLSELLKEVNSLGSSSLATLAR